MRPKSQLIHEARQITSSRYWWARFFIHPERYQFERNMLPRLISTIKQYVDDQGQIKYPQPFFSALQMMINDWVRFEGSDAIKGIIFLHHLQAELFITLIKQRLQPQTLPSILTTMDQTLISIHFQSVIEGHCLARETKLTEAELPNIYEFPKRLRCCVMSYGGPALATVAEKMLQTERRERVIIPFPIQKAS